MMSSAPRRVWAGCAALACLLSGRLAEAQDDALARLLGRTVTDVRVEIERRPGAPADLSGLIDVRVGEPLTVGALRRSGDRLGRLPAYDNVIVLAQPTDAGVAIIFDLVPRHPVDRVEFRGALGVGEALLAQAVRTQYGGVPATVRTAEVEDVVRRALEEEGFRRAAVTGVVVESHAPHRATLVLEVTAGERTRIARTVVEGQSPLSAETILAETGAAAGAPFRQRAIDGRLSEIESDLRARRYYTAVARQRWDTSDDGRLVDLTLIVDAGPLVDVRIEPERDMPRGRRDDLIPIRREASIDVDLIDESARAIAEALRADGFWRAAVTVRQDTPQAGRLMVTFAIDRGRRYRIDRFEFADGLELDRAVIDEALGLSPGDLFYERAVQAALVRVMRAYQARGYHRVEIQPVFEERTDRASPTEASVIVRPVVQEGPRATVASVDFDLEGTSVGRSALTAVMETRAGAPYVVRAVRADQLALVALYEARGFGTATVGLSPAVSEDGRTVRITVSAREGPQLRVGAITVIGNRRVPTDVILRDLSLVPGAPYSEAARRASERRLYDSTSFSVVRILADPVLPGDTDVALTVAVEEAPATTMDTGGGVEVYTLAQTTPEGVRDRVEVSPHAFFAIGRRNLWGRNRSIDFFSRASLGSATLVDASAGADYGLNEYRFTGTYRERYAFRTDSDVLVGFTAEQAVRTSFSFARRAANAEFLHVLRPRLTASGRYGLEFNRVFDNGIREEDRPLIDRLFPQVRLSLVSAGVLWDGRNDQIAPTRGGQVAVTGDLALRQIGSEVGFVKGFAQATYFRTLTGLRSSVLALRGQLGLARGFERVVTVIDPAAGTPAAQIVADLPASQRFFAGGSTSVRGFQLDRLGVADVLSDTGLSNGGNGLVVLNAELRTDAGRLFGRRLGVVGFVDAGNVFARTSDVSLAGLRATAGFGARYDSPLGPVRLDLGFKTTLTTFRNGRRERGWDFHLSLGEAF
jgi:outer membrane protein assembly complex protein YaeT